MIYDEFVIVIFPIFPNPHPEDSEKRADDTLYSY
jgi:hypothetical protein